MFSLAVDTMLCFSLRMRIMLIKTQLLLLPSQGGGWCAQGFGSRHSQVSRPQLTLGISHTTVESCWTIILGGSWSGKGTDHSLGTGWALIRGWWATVLCVTHRVYPFITISPSSSDFLSHPTGGSEWTARWCLASCWIKANNTIDSGSFN